MEIIPKAAIAVAIAVSTSEKPEALPLVEFLCRMDGLCAFMVTIYAQGEPRNSLTTLSLFGSNVVGDVDRAFLMTWVRMWTRKVFERVVSLG